MGDFPASVDRLGPHDYVFRSTWIVDAPPAPVFEVLRHVFGYPDWWPEFKYAKELSDGYGEFGLRSFLPVNLRFTLKRDIEDADALHLRANVAGDIVGFVEWRCEAIGEDTRAEFIEEVELRHSLARPFDRFLRPALEANHRAAMRNGQRGLATLLAARQSGRD